MNAKEALQSVCNRCIADGSPVIVERRPAPVYSIHVFDSAEMARMYRHVNGTGGWIFAGDGGGLVILFPPHMSPASIFHHPMVKGKSGELIGAA
jgi:hypothetical protein